MCPVEMGYVLYYISYILKWGLLPFWPCSIPDTFPNHRMSIDWLPPEKQPGAEGWCSTHRAWPLGATEGTHNFGFYRVLHSIQVRQVFFDHAVIHWRNRSCSQQQLPRWPETCATSDRKGAEPCRFWCCACQSDLALTINLKLLDSQPVYVKFFGSHPSNILNRIYYFIFQSVTAHQASCGAVARRVLAGSRL